MEVSEELNSVETSFATPGGSWDGRVSEELNSVETMNYLKRYKPKQLSFRRT